MGFSRIAIKRLAVIAGLVTGVGATAAASAAETTIFPDDRTMGSPKAPIVMIEYAAPVCPHCAHFAKDILPKVKKSYIDKGKVFYVLRIFPLSPLDGAVAGMAKCAGPKRYFEFIDLAFRKQSVWDPDGNTIPDVKAGMARLGKLGGLKQKQIERCMADPQETERVNRIAQDGEVKYDVKSVPTLVINGTVVHAAEADWPQLQARIDGLLADKK